MPGSATTESYDAEDAQMQHDSLSQETLVMGPCPSSPSPATKRRRLAETRFDKPLPLMTDSAEKEQRQEKAEGILASSSGDADTKISGDAKNISTVTTSMEDADTKISNTEKSSTVTAEH